jgi:hypothetical protein
VGCNEDRECRSGRCGVPFNTDEGDSVCLTLGGQSCTDYDCESCVIGSGGSACLGACDADSNCWVSGGYYCVKLGSATGTCLLSCSQDEDCDLAYGGDCRGNELFTMPDQYALVCEP